MFIFSKTFASSVTHFPSFSSYTASALLAATSTSVGVAIYTCQETTKCDDNQRIRSNDSQSNVDEHFRIESHFMDRIQQKQYLKDAKEQIPSTFRVLAIDLKEMRNKAFTGTCRLSQDKVFLEDVALPKEIAVEVDRHANNKEDLYGNDENNLRKVDRRKGTTKKKIKVSQKALIKNIIYCSSPQSQQHVGVEMLEASVADLNPMKLRKRQGIGEYTYDPGKYYDSPSKTDHPASVESGGDVLDFMDEMNPDMSVERQTTLEEEAPWNQYAWMEELRLRINGQVHFDAPMEKSSPFERVLFGDVYKITIPAVHRIMDYFIPFSFAKSDPDGVDGRNQAHVRAGNKPHAVVANGAALQLVPSSLRLLQKICKKADVPLFVVHDPRAWGGNTQASLEEALIAMRSTVKNRIISNALKQQGSLAFTRGRMLGQAETEAKWQLRDKKQKTKELLGLSGRPKRKKEDWSQHDMAMLEKKLIDRKVIQKVVGENDLDMKLYTPAMIELALKCVRDTTVNAGLTLTSPPEGDDKSHTDEQSSDTINTL